MVLQMIEQYDNARQSAFDGGTKGDFFD